MKSAQNTISILMDTDFSLYLINFPTYIGRRADRPRDKKFHPDKSFTIDLLNTAVAPARVRKSMVRPMQATCPPPPPTSRLKA